MNTNNYPASNLKHLVTSSSEVDRHNPSETPFLNLPPKRHRTKFSTQQLKILEQEFEKNYYPDIFHRQEIANQTGLTSSRIQVWFQNKRAKIKKNCDFAFELDRYFVEPDSLAPVSSSGSSGLSSLPEYSGQFLEPIMFYQNYKKFSPETHKNQPIFYNDGENQADSENVRLLAESEKNLTANFYRDRCSSLPATAGSHQPNLAEFPKNLESLQHLDLEPNFVKEFEAPECNITRNQLADRIDKLENMNLVSPSASGDYKKFSDRRNTCHLGYGQRLQNVAEQTATFGVGTGIDLTGFSGGPNKIYSTPVKNSRAVNQHPVSHNFIDFKSSQKPSNLQMIEESPLSIPMLQKRQNTSNDEAEDLTENERNSLLDPLVEPLATSISGLPDKLSDAGLFSNQCLNLYGSDTCNFYEDVDFNLGQKGDGTSDAFTTGF